MTKRKRVTSVVGSKKKTPPPSWCARSKALFWLLLITCLPPAPAPRARSTTSIPLLMELRWFKSVHGNSGLISSQGATVSRTRRELLFSRSTPIELHSATEQPPQPSISYNYQNFRQSHHYLKGFYWTNIWRCGATVHGFSVAGHSISDPSLICLIHNTSGSRKVLVAKFDIINVLVIDVFKDYALARSF